MLKIFYILSIFLLFDQFNARATDYDDILQDFQEINDIKGKNKICKIKLFYLTKLSIQ